MSSRAAASGTLSVACTALALAVLLTSGSGATRGGTPGSPAPAPAADVGAEQSAVPCSERDRAYDEAADRTSAELLGRLAAMRPAIRTHDWVGLRASAPRLEAGALAALSELHATAPCSSGATSERAYRILLATDWLNVARLILEVKPDGSNTAGVRQRIGLNLEAAVQHRMLVEVTRARRMEAAPGP